jgi:hypothetical protein
MARIGKGLGGDGKGFYTEGEEFIEKRGRITEGRG